MGKVPAEVDPGLSLNPTYKTVAEAGNPNRNKQLTKTPNVPRGDGKPKQIRSQGPQEAP